MATITAGMVKQLRDQTGAGMMECKGALSEAGGDIEEAMTLLRKRGLAQAAKRAGRATAQGLVGSYIPPRWADRSLGRDHLRVGLRRPHRGFPEPVKEIAMHIAAADPRWVRREDVPAEAIEQEKNIYRAQVESSGKPPHVLDRIVEGKLGSFYSQFVLLEQPSIRDGSLTVAQVVAQAQCQDR